mmetsp:Transcript_37928/g.90751  ORF Transcript_37928/g.90751 Transcript_37928/m.90751 type:complete len:89 (-) Transcript_37928:61-327(-)
MVYYHHASLPTCRAGTFRDPMQSVTGHPLLSSFAGPSMLPVARLLVHEAADADAAEYYDGSVGMRQLAIGPKGITPDIGRRSSSWKGL